MEKLLVENIAYMWLSGMQSNEVCADSGYGSEQNYAHMFGLGIVPYVH